MRKFLFSIVFVLLFSAALGQIDPQVSVQINTTHVKDVSAIATQYDLTNTGVASQVRSQIRNTVRESFNDAIASVNTFREQVIEIAQDVAEYDFNYFCPPAIVMTPKDAAIGWIIEKAKGLPWLRELYRDYCPTYPNRFLTGIRDYLQDHDIPLVLRQACITISAAADRCAEIDTTKCTEIRELLIPKIETEIEACENNKNWVSTNIAPTATSSGAVSGLPSISSSAETTASSTAEVYDDAGTVAIATVDPCAFAYRHKERAERALELCERYIETCVSRCNRIDAIVDECERVAANREELIANLTARLRSFCLRRSITEQIHHYINETVSSGEIVPVIVATWLNATESDFTYVQSVELIKELESYKIFRVSMEADRISDLRNEAFVLRAHFDKVVRAVGKAAIVYVRTSAIAPNVTKHLASIEAVKVNIDPTLKPEVEDTEDDIETVSDEVTSQEDTENGRGPIYAFLRLLGLAAGTEVSDANFYEQKAQELNDTISKLENVAETTTDDVAAATLLDTANELHQKAQEMRQRAQQKRTNARGIFSFIFGGG